MPRLTAIPAALLCVVLAFSVTDTNAKVASQWVNDARATSGSFDTAKRTVIMSNADCTASVTVGGDTTQPVSGPILLASGVGIIIDLCNHADSTNTAYITGDDLFANSAFRKAESTEGYVKADVFSAAEVVAGHCVSLYFVPVKPGFYPLKNEKCLVSGVGQTLASVEITGTASDTLEQETLPQWKAAADRVEAVTGAQSSSWAPWTDVTDIEINLVATPGCNRPAATGRRLLQAPPTDADFSEGDGENVDLAALDLMWVYSKGHTGLTSSLIVDSTPVASQIEGGEGSSPASRRLSQTTAVSTEGEAPEGTGTVEGLTGQIEGATTTEGNAADAAPSVEGEAPEGAGTVEGLTGAVEGDATNEGNSAVVVATPSASEGNDLIVEGAGEGAVATAAGSPDAMEGDDSITEGAGEGSSPPAATEGDDGILEGLGEGQTVTVGDFVSASDYPIEMVVNMPYRITFSVLRSGGNSFYFSAPEFFADAVVRKVESTFVEFKFATYPTEIERSSGSWEMYVVPTVKGDYQIKSGNLDQKVLPFGRIRVIDGTPTDGAKFKKVQIATGECPPGVIVSSASSLSALGFTAFAGVVAAFLAL